MIQYIQKSKNSSYHLMVMLTQSCNLQCTYCFSYDNSKSKLEFNDPTLFYNELVNNIKSYQLRHPELETVLLEFFGGEPLLRYKQIKEIINLIKTEQKLIDIKIEYVIPSNLILLTEDMIDFFYKHNVKLSLSYDGLWNSIQRPQVSGAKTQSLNKSIIKEAIEKNLISHLHCMIYPTGIKVRTIVDNYLWLKQAFPNLETRFEIVRDNHTWNANTFELLKDQLSDLLALILKPEWQEIDEIIPSIFQKPLLAIINYDIKGFSAKSCGITDTRSMLAPDLKEYPCNIFIGKNLDTTDLKKDLVKVYSNNKCLNCEIYNYCDKGCPAQMLTNTDNEQEDILCQIFKELNKCAKMLIIYSRQFPKSGIASQLKKLIKNEGI